MNIERRAFTVDALGVVRAAEKGARIVGHAAVFDREADIGGWFIESVAPGAFRRAIVEDDVRALFNHDANLVLGRNRAGTLKLAEDEVGLAIEISPPDTQVARDLVVSLERGDISQMSFGFRVLRQEWDETGDLLKRRLLEVELYDVSPVTFPAYTQTDVGLRTITGGMPGSVGRRLAALGCGAEMTAPGLGAGPRGMNTQNAAPSIRRGIKARAY
jgi:hypothetical protein